MLMSTFYCEKVEGDIYDAILIDFMGDDAQSKVDQRILGGLGFYIIGPFYYRFYRKKNYLSTHTTRWLRE